jgi:putative SOS response-associated peptidase YedK
MRVVKVSVKIKSMCGRYTLYHSSNEIVDRFRTMQVEFDLEQRFNIAPTQLVAVVAEKAESGKIQRHLEPVKWGLVPFWVKDITTFKPFFNTRVETIAEKPSFKAAFTRRRCLIPCDGFYEWKKTENGKIPMFITLEDNSTFGMAGIYETWSSKDGGELTTCSIITVPANNFMSDIHDRMPAIVRREDEDFWLNPLEVNNERLLSVLKPYDNAAMRAHPVSSMVNSPRTESVRLIEEVTIEQALEKPPSAAKVRESSKKRNMSEDTGQLKLF